MSGQVVDTMDRTPTGGRQRTDEREGQPVALHHGSHFPFCWAPEESSLANTPLHGLAAEDERMLLELITHLIGDEDVQGDSRA
jgi:hypothetical protein